MFLILHPYKFTEFNQALYDVDLLKKKLGSKVEIHDLSEIVNKEWNSAFLQKRQKGIKIFTSLNEWISYYKNLRKNKNFVIFNLLDVDTLKSLIIHYTIMKSDVKTLKSYTPGVSHTETYLKWKISKSKIKNIFFQPKKLFFFIKKKFFHFLFKCMRFKKNYILYSGKKKVNPFHLKNDIYVKFHSFEYSKYLTNKNKKQKASNKVIFLDSAGPYFVDDYKLFGYNIKIDKKKWYNELNKLFNDIERIFNYKVCIIPHPKNKGFTNPLYNKKFKVIHDQDAALNYVSNSKFVIVNSATTAITHAVSNYRKILLVVNNQVIKNDKKRLMELRLLAKNLSSSLINISEEIRNKNILKSVNKRAYENYKYKFLTSKSITNKMNYQIFKDIINK